MKTLYFILTFCILACKEPKIQVEILPLHPYVETYEFEGISSLTCKGRIAYYYINATLSDSVNLRREIESFIKVLPDTVYRNYCASTIYFYKKSKKFNEKYINDYSDDLESSGDDIIAQTSWDNGRRDGLFFLDNGRLIAPGKDVELKLVEDSLKR